MKKEQQTTMSKNMAMDESTLDQKSFDNMGLIEPLNRALSTLGFSQPTPIQALAIPELLSGVDVMGQAQTGTGKTAAFGLPLLQKIDPKKRSVQALVLLPTRELALQVAEALVSFSQYLPRCVVLPLYGGTSMGPQLDALKRQDVHVVVGTPGRILDHIKRGTLDLSKVEFLVLDEADEMLKMGFAEDVNDILQKTSANRQLAFFSATISTGIKSLSKKYLKEPRHIRVNAPTTAVSTIEQKSLQVASGQKFSALVRILECTDAEGVLIFTRTKLGASELAAKLSGYGFLAESLHSDMSQAERQRVLKRLQDKQANIVVATDVAARGLDVPHLSYVINYDIPNEPEVYIHRIGRTGRAGNKGTSVLFFSGKERAQFRLIEQFAKRAIPQMSIPSDEEVENGRYLKLKKRVLQAFDGEYSDFLSQAKQLVRDVKQDANSVIAVLLSLLENRKKKLPQLVFEQDNSFKQRDIHQFVRAVESKSRNERSKRSGDDGDKKRVSFHKKRFLDKKRGEEKREFSSQGRLEKRDRAFYSDKKVKPSRHSK